MRGKELFEKRCSGCHSLDRDMEGPIWAAFTDAAQVRYPLFLTRTRSRKHRSLGMRTPWSMVDRSGTVGPQHGHGLSCGEGGRTHGNHPIFTATPRKMIAKARSPFLANRSETWGLT